MVNQDPQPEVFDSEFTFAAAAAANTSITNTIYTLQGQNEEVRIYAFTAQVTDANDAPYTLMFDYDMELVVGANTVPSNPFDISWVSQSDELTCSFTVPVVVKFKQPLQVRIIPRTAVPAETNIRIQLIGETGVIKV
tara:strand:- start:1373 stop:1783 length:411 start_codon:yes stop_codon:yes gene_type:complete